MELPGTYPCGAQPWEMPGAAVLLPAVRCIPHSDNYKVGLKPVPVSGNLPFSIYHSFPTLGPSREPPSSPASEPGAGQRLGRSGRDAGPAGRGKTRAPGGRHGALTDLLCGGSGGGAGCGTAGLDAGQRRCPRRCHCHRHRRRVCGRGGGSPAIRGGGRGRDPAAGKLRLHLPPREGNREIPCGEGGRQRGAWPRGSVPAEELSPGALSRQTGERGTLGSLPEALAVGYVPLQGLETHCQGWSRCLQKCHVLHLEWSCLDLQTAWGMRKGT